MAISVNWLTGEITIPKADTVLVSAGPPEIRQFDVDQFWLDLKDAEYSVDGIPWPDTQRHGPSVTLSGDIYVQIIEVITPYFTTFEDGQYVVNLIGGNHNLLDVSSANQVSLKAFNSAGKVIIEGSAIKGLFNKAVVVPEGGGTKLVTVFDDDGVTVLYQHRVSADNLSRERLV